MLCCCHVQQFRYLMANESPVEAARAKARWNSVLSALQELGFSANLCTNMTRVLAAILHLGNVSFSKDDAAAVLDVNQLNFAAELLMVSHVQTYRCAQFVL